MSIFSSLFGGGQPPAVKFAISDQELLVGGWSDSELRKILDDFQRMYRAQLPANFTTEIDPGDGGILLVKFSSDIAPNDFCFLVNYVQYPKEFDLKSRSILVVGGATMNSDFLPAAQGLVGKRIMFYIPTDDRNYDVVFARVNGQSYKCRFTFMRWQQAPEPRIPAGIANLVEMA